MARVRRPPPAPLGGGLPPAPMPAPAPAPVPAGPPRVRRIIPAAPAPAPIPALGGGLPPASAPAPAPPAPMLAPMITVGGAPVVPVVLAPVGGTVTVVSKTAPVGGKKKKGKPAAQKKGGNASIGKLVAVGVVVVALIYLVVSIVDGVSEFNAGTAAGNAATSSSSP